MQPLPQINLSHCQQKKLDSKKNKGNSGKSVYDVFTAQAMSSSKKIKFIFLAIVWRHPSFSRKFNLKFGKNCLKVFQEDL